MDDVKNQAVQGTRVLYCHCRYAQVVPKDVKEAILRQLSDSNMEFEAVADLCELSARKDASLNKLSQAHSLKIVACFPRAVKWLFAAAGAGLPGDRTEVCNMRVDSAQDVWNALVRNEVQPNLPEGKGVIPKSEQTPVMRNSEE